MSERRDRRAALRPVGLGLEFAAALIGGCLVGLWVDRHYATAPWGLTVGLAIGLIGGFYNFLRASILAFRSVAQPPPAEDDREGD